MKRIQCPFLFLCSSLIVFSFTPRDMEGASPLLESGWVLVAHMSNTGGLFDGNGDLDSTFSDGTFVANPTPGTSDFARAFPIVASEILFISGDELFWAIADYNDLRNLIDARAEVFDPNIQLQVAINGVESNTVGNVLSRLANSEDPFISIDGDHFSGVANGLIIWGEIDFAGAGHIALKNTHNGVNVYVRAEQVIPTLTEWGIFSLILLLAGAAFFHVRKLSPTPADFH